jgi:hypothetical protein
MLFLRLAQGWEHWLGAEFELDKIRNTTKLFIVGAVTIEDPGGISFGRMNS